MQPLITGLDDYDTNDTVIDPLVRIFLKRQKRMETVKKRREASVVERFQRFASKKYYTIRRGYVELLCIVSVLISTTLLFCVSHFQCVVCNVHGLIFRFLMTAIALRNLAVGLPPLEQLKREVDYANLKEPEAEANQDERLKDEVGHGEL